MHSILDQSTPSKLAVVEALSDETYVELLNRTFRLHGRQVFLRPLKSWNDVQVSEQAKAEPGKLFIKNIPLDMSNQTLQSIFARFGELRYCYIVRPKRIPRSNAYYGFANYLDPRISRELAESSPLRIQGIDLLVCLFKAPKTDKNADKNTINKIEKNKESNCKEESKIQSGTAEYRFHHRTPAPGHIIIRPKKLDLFEELGQYLPQQSNKIHIISPVWDSSDTTKPSKIYQVVRNLNMAHLQHRLRFNK